MFFKKSDEDYQGKKYLLVIVIIIIIAALSLWVIQAFNKDSFIEEDVAGSTELSFEKKDSNPQSYLSANTFDYRLGDRYIGNREAPLKIFVYEDYDDIFSANLAVDINKVIKDKGDEIVFVFRPFINHSSSSIKKALTLDCVNSPSNWQFLREAFMKDLNEKKQASLEDIVASSGISEDGLYNCLTESQKSGRIEELRKENLDNNIIGSPTILVHDELIVGARPYDDYENSEGEKVEGLKNLIDRILSEI